MRIYIIHPEEKTPDYYKKITMAELKLLQEGHEVLNPSPKTKTFDNVDLFRLYAAKLNECDAVFAMNRWGASEIGNLEMANAMQLRRTITFEQDVT